MTWVDWLKALGRAAWIIIGWLALIVAAGALFFLAKSCDQKEVAEALLRRAQERWEAEKAQLIVVYELNERALRAEMEQYKKDPEFASAVEKAEETIKGKPVLVARMSTGPIKVRRTEPKSPEHETIPPENETTPDAKEPEPCELRAGDEVDIVVTEAVIEGQEGSLVVAGAARVDRVSPNPSANLFSGEFRADASRAAGKGPALERKLGWGGGALAGYGTRGPIGSLLAATPPFFDDHFSLMLEGTFGSDFALQGGFFYRF